MTPKELESFYEARDCNQEERKRVYYCGEYHSLFCPRICDYALRKEKLDGEKRMNLFNRTIKN